MSDLVRRTSVKAAERLKRDIDRFQSRWPSEPTSAHPPLTLTWEQLERQLSALVESSTKRELVSALVSGTRKQAWAKPPEMVLREILLIATTLADDAFCPSEEEASDPMT